MTSDEHEKLLSYQVEGLAAIAQEVQDANRDAADRHKELMGKLESIADALGSIRRNTSS